MPKDRLWVCDLHTHSCFSPDSLISPAAFLRACRRKGLDRVAVTDHNAIAGALKLKEMDPDRVIVGEEIRTTQGELIAYFVRELVPAGLPPLETIARVREQGGVVGVSHPLDELRREAMGRASLIPILEQVDFLEVLNARCFFSGYNRAAFELAQEADKLMTAGSDAHSTGELGRAVIEMPPFHDASSFLESLASAHIRGRISPPWVHFTSRYAKLARRLGLAAPIGR